MHQTTQASGVFYCNENTLANTNMYSVSIRSVQTTQSMFHISVEGIPVTKKKVHSQWVCVSLNIANSECAQNLKLLIASYSFCSLVSLKCKIWNNPQMLHTNPHMHGVLLAWDWWTCEVSQMASWFDWHGNIFADSLLPSRYSNWKSSTSGCYQRKFVLCQWYCFWLKPIKKCSTETHLTVSSKQVNKRLLDLQVQMSTSLGCSSGNKGKQSPDKYKELKMAVPNLHVSTVNQR